MTIFEFLKREIVNSCRLLSRLTVSENRHGEPVAELRRRARLVEKPRGMTKTY
jgi:hypothetical protein